MRPPLTFVICATPRTGSTLLCALMASTGIAGRPESWYRAEDRADYAADWGVPCDADGHPDARAYLDGAIAAGQSPNGLCGLRVQAATLSDLLAELRTLLGADQTDRALFDAAFGSCHFVWCRRGDDVAQAVSRLKAEVSQVWHLDGTEPDRPAGRATYDPARIDAFRAEAVQGNATWADWFAAEGIRPTVFDYETFTQDPPGHVRALIAAAGLALPPGTTIAAPNRRMADRESAEWIARYRADRGLAPAPA